MVTEGADQVAAIRARSADLIARANGTLATPRPEAIMGGYAREPSPPPAAPAPMAERPVPVATQAELNRRLAAIEAAVGQKFGLERHAHRLRIVEAERRIAELEARLAALEGGQ